MTEKPFRIDPNTRALQEQASSPALSAWVSANAGSGKTHVLSQRVIRLLLAGVEPSRILCLTYTKTAAAEMVNRVFERLAAWTLLDDAKLAEAMRGIGETDTGRDRLRLARTLFARALETPGGLQIQTIHAFCTTILKRFPLEANIAGHFDMMDDETSGVIESMAVQQLKIEAHAATDEALASAYELALDEAGEQGLENLFAAVLSGPQRSAILAFLDAVDAGLVSPQDLAKTLNLKAGQNREDVLDALWPLQALPIGLVKMIAAGANGKSDTIRTFSQRLTEASFCTDREERFTLLQSIFLTEGKPRSPKNYAKAADGFGDIFTAAAEEVVGAKELLSRLSLLELSRSAHVIMRRLSVIHRAMKRERGLLDYDDLIEATHRLLQRDAAAAWVQYKLDQGIDHVLVDEAQDTNPRQWSIINTLTGDFFAGKSARVLNRTIFVVGDEKQSIYSFQGARPEVFGQTGKEKAGLAKRADVGFKQLTMPLSFRSVPEILDTVDKVFGEADARTGLIGDTSEVQHSARRMDEHGRVEVWDMIVGEKAERKDDDWTTPVDHVTAPALQLAGDIAATIEDMVHNGRNPASGASVQPGDILVLVRKRDKFMHALSRELKDRKIPVAGADRLTLTGHIAIQDLMAIARITLQPADDLSLAALLRSPVFGISDDDLTALSAKRRDGQYLAERIAERAEAGDLRYTAIARQLKIWRDEADFAPVHEFYARVLGRDGMRVKLIARLGGEAADVIDEFMAYALASEKAGVHGLQSFVETLARAEPEIKRELGGKRGEVRIMTVHGAKGLEAKYVFLVDPGSPAVSASHLPPLTVLPVHIGNRQLDAFFWVPKAGFRNSATAKPDEAHRQLQEAEYRRLLYVGMTRAEDVLVVCGFMNSKRDIRTWNDMARAGLMKFGKVEQEVHPLTGRNRLVYQPEPAAQSLPTKDTLATKSKADLPDWLTRAVAPAPKVPRPLTPSGLGVSVEDPPVLLTQSPVFAERQAAGPAMQRGSAIHRLLEVLPSIDPPLRLEKAKLYLSRRLGEGQEKLAEQVTAILEDHRFADLFSGASRAEVSIGGNVMIDGMARPVSGKIDRLVVTRDAVLIADYKTTRPAPKDRLAVPHTHVAQLALYAEVLKGIYPDCRIGASLVYTEGPYLHAYDEIELSAALAAVTAT